MIFFLPFTPALSSLCPMLENKYVIHIFERFYQSLINQSNNQSIITWSSISENLSRVLLLPLLTEIVKYTYMKTGLKSELYTDNLHHIIYQVFTYYYLVLAPMIAIKTPLWNSLMILLLWPTEWKHIQANIVQLHTVTLGNIGELYHVCGFDLRLPYKGSDTGRSCDADY